MTTDAENKGPDWLEGDSVLLSGIQKIFVKNVPPQMEKLREALAAGDVSGVELLSHSIKGAAAMIGAAPLRDEANKVERAAMDKKMGEARDFFEGMEREFAITINKLTDK